MTAALTDDSAGEDIDDGGPVRPFRIAHIEDANYLLSVGDEIYVSSSEARNTIHKLTDEKENFSIEPGQFAFVLTEESISLPFNVIGFISIRASIKFLGLVNISGFHVDPGYSGKLIFAVFNAGPSRIHLKKGDKIFPLWLADLDHNISREVIKEGYANIPSTLINPISGQFTTAYQVKEQLDSIKEDVTKLKEFRLYVACERGRPSAYRECEEGWQRRGRGQKMRIPSARRNILGTSLRSRGTALSETTSSPSRFISDMRRK
jgi:dCTP deaminase